MFPQRVSRGGGHPNIVSGWTGKDILYWQYLPLKFGKRKSDFQCGSEALLSKYNVALSM